MLPQVLFSFGINIGVGQIVRVGTANFGGEEQRESRPKQMREAIIGVKVRIEGVDQFLEGFD